jgi:hypothetical protein
MAVGSNATMVTGREEPLVTFRLNLNQGGVIVVPSTGIGAVITMGESGLTVKST